MALFRSTTLMSTTFRFREFGWINLSVTFALIRFEAFRLGLSGRTAPIAGARTFTQAGRCEDVVGECAARASEP